jgi:hypothetical protein
MGIDPPLLQAVKFAQPIEGYVHFRLDNCTAMSVIRNHMVVSAIDGQGKRVTSCKRSLTWIKQPERAGERTS